MLPSYFTYILVHLRQKARLMPGLSTTFLSTLGPNPTRKARPRLTTLFLNVKDLVFLNYSKNARNVIQWH